MRFSQFALLLAAILVSPAAAQQTANPVTAHYRTYREALERGDLATAESEATAALEAAQLNTQNASQVAALAMNTALVRLSAGHRAQALPPAQLAMSLAANPQSHVDPLAVEIALKRASLRTGDQSEADLLRVLGSAQEQTNLAEFVYDGAADLGSWARQQGHLSTAVSAWRIASHVSPGDDDADILSRAHALAELGVALFDLDTQAASSPPQQATPLPLRNPAVHLNTEVYTVLLEAARITQPLAARPAADGGITRAQLLYARAIAFATAELSRLAALSVDTRPLPRLDRSLVIASHSGATLCNIRVIAQPQPTFPPREVNAEHVAGVNVRLVINDAGRVTDARVVAAVGGPAFEQAVATVAGRWSVERAPDAPTRAPRPRRREQALASSRRRLKGSTRAASISAFGVGLKLALTLSTSPISSSRASKGAMRPRYAPISRPTALPARTRRASIAASKFESNSALMNGMLSLKRAAPRLWLLSKKVAAHCGSP
ncbi:MAG: energy transducer TonB [Proteobacteria bacterium]|nr:energy transducer TonB [Pseudomonadota bacterium]